MVDIFMQNENAKKFTYSIATEIENNLHYIYNTTQYIPIQGSKIVENMSDSLQPET